MSGPSLRLFGGPTLFDGTGAPVSGGPVQRHRIALLAQLAIAAPGGVSRERLMGLLWPDRPPASSRNLLNVSVATLRQSFGAELIITARENLRLGAGMLDVDVHDFEDAIDQGRLEDALRYYRGAFLEGFFLDGSVEFERWAESQRMRLAQCYVDALRVLAKRAQHDGDTQRAIGWLRALAYAEPTNPQLVLQLFDALVEAGDVTGALAAEESHSAHMRGEVGVEPDARVAARAQALRIALMQPSHGPVLPRVVPLPATADAPPVRAPRVRWRRGHVFAIAGVVLVIGLGSLAWSLTLVHRRGTGTNLVTAVLPLVRGNQVPADIADGIDDLLALNLEQVDGIRVSRPDHADAAAIMNGTMDAATAGRAMRAAFVVSGHLVVDGATMTATFTVLDSTGALVGTAVTTQADSVQAVPSLIDAASVQLTRLLWGRRWSVPAPRVAAVSTTSMPAMAAFLRGETAFRSSQWDSAAAAYQAATDLDSTFALAYMRLAEALAWHSDRGDDAAQRALNRAAHFAGRLPPRDKALLNYRQLAAVGDFRAIGAAGEFADRYRGDPDAEFSLADVLYHALWIASASPDSLARMWTRAAAADPGSLHPLDHGFAITMEADDHPAFEQVLAMRMARGAPPLTSVERFDTLLLWAPLQAARDSILALVDRVAVGRDTVSTLHYALASLIERCMEGREDCDGIDAAVVATVARIMARAGLSGGGNGTAEQGLRFGEGRMADAMPVHVGDPIGTAHDAIVCGILGYEPDAFALDAIHRLQHSPEHSWRFSMRIAQLALTRHDISLARSALDDATRLLSGDSATRGPFAGPYSAALTHAAGGWLWIVAGDTARGLLQIRTGLQGAGYSSYAGQEGEFLVLEEAITMAAYRPTRGAGIDLLNFKLADNGVYWPMLRYDLARALDAQGDSVGAANQYRRFTLVWQHSDPPLQHFATYARQRAAELATR